MPKQRLDIYGRAHKLMRFLSDEEILPEISINPDAVIANSNQIVKQLQDEFGVDRSVAIHAVSDVIRERRTQRKSRHA